MWQVWSTIITAGPPKLLFRYNNSVSDKYYLCFKTLLIYLGNSYSNAFIYILPFCKGSEKSQNQLWCFRCQLYAKIVFVRAINKSIYIYTSFYKIIGLYWRYWLYWISHYSNTHIEFNYVSVRKYRQNILKSFNIVIPQNDATIVDNRLFQQF